VGDIAANLLHHLNNKVGTIPVRIQGIQDKCQATLLADPYLMANLAEIERSATQAMAAMREGLLQLHPIQLAPVRVADCVAAAVATAGLPDGVQVHREGLDQLPPVLAAQRSLTLVFHNLLQNATDAMQADGLIAIRGGVTADRQVKVAVSDSGPGISPELYDRIFEFSYSGRTPARPGRLGFGLWWVKTLMARLGGSVTVDSDARRGGTTFWLTLPQAE
jgi:signal transduction histidine kinase